MFLRQMKNISLVLLSFYLIGIANLAAQASLWDELTPVTSPPPRFNFSMAYDPMSEQLIVFGGAIAGDSTTINLNDTWNWDGATWTQLFPINAPPGREGAVLAYDDPSGQLLLFGGLTDNPIGDTWTWNGLNWEQQFPLNSPPARYGAAMSYNKSTMQMILFGGTDAFGNFLNDTWEWTGSNWIQLTPATSPPARVGLSLAYDSSSEQLILFGGAGNLNILNDTWNWDGTNWVQLNPAHSPPATLYASLAYDESSQKLILFGGNDSDGSQNATYAWNGIDWELLVTSTSPSPRYEAGLAYDLLTNQMILFGGRYLNLVYNDTWDFVLAAPTVTGVTPNTGSQVGGTSIVITGTGFTGVTAVYFGDASATSFSFVSDTEIDAVSPPGIGTVDIIVMAQGGSSASTSADRFTYIPPSPPQPLPPVNVRGVQLRNVFAAQTEIANIITWESPTSGLAPIGYIIYQNSELTKKVATISAAGPYKYMDHIRRRKDVYYYYIVSIDEQGQQSLPVEVVIKSHH